MITIRYHIENNKGQALITLLFFMLMGLSIITAAVIISATSSISSQKFKSGILASMHAETGAEEAYLRILRNPNYSGEILNIDGAVVTVMVNGTNPYVITSKSVFGGFSKTSELRILYSNGQYTVQSWKELY